MISPVRPPKRSLGASTPSTLPSTKRSRAESKIESCTPSKDIRCGLHGIISLEPLLVAVTDSPIFQRLRRLRQLGVSDHVYPTATHSRFEHSLGVCHLAGKLCRKLKAQAMPSGATPPSERDILCVKLAGLCHDIGHGPFSHTFEGIVKFKHEQMSSQLLDLLFSKELKLSDYTADGEALEDESDLIFVKELIEGTAPKERKGRGRSKWYLYNIVSGRIDVDRLDYLLRDSKCSLGLDGVFALDHILDNTAVRMAKCEDDDEPYPVVAFARKAAAEIWKVFQCRYEMFDKVYLHASTVGRELLLKDLLRALSTLPPPACYVIAGKTLQEAAQSAADFARLDDHIVTRLSLRLDDLRDVQQSQPALMRAAALLDRYSRHSHYPKLAEWIVSQHTKEGECGGRVVISDAPSAYRPTVDELRQELGEDEFMIFERNVHHGDRAENPMSSMRFFQPKVDGSIETNATPIHEPELWLPLPTYFMRKTASVYFKGEDKEAAKTKIRNAVTALLRPKSQAGSDAEEEEPTLSQGHTTSDCH
jgi:HD superfamily phosphohydrolase